MSSLRDCGCATGLRGMQKWEDDVLELYHNINSVCAQKVRIALKEKRQEAKDHIMTLRGDQHETRHI